jgi:hypothetical protein
MEEVKTISTRDHVENSYDKKRNLIFSDWNLCIEKEKAARVTPCNSTETIEIDLTFIRLDIWKLMKDKRESKSKLNSKTQQIGQSH